MLLTLLDLTSVILQAGMLLIMPGPTNTLLLFSGATAGFLKSCRLISCEIAGYLIAITIWA